MWNWKRFALLIVSSDQIEIDSGLSIWFRKEDLSIRSKQRFSAYDLNWGSQHTIWTEDLSIWSKLRISAYDLEEVSKADAALRVEVRRECRGLVWQARVSETQHRFAYFCPPCFSDQPLIICTDCDNEKDVDDHVDGGRWRRWWWWRWVWFGRRVSETEHFPHFCPPGKDRWAGVRWIRWIRW